jgi:hypothetical protein
MEQRAVDSHDHDSRIAHDIVQACQGYAIALIDIQDFQLGAGVADLVVMYKRFDRPGML